MYAGRIVEHTDAATLYARPAHPYTRGLMDSVPRVDDAGGVRGAPLRPVPGLPPSLTAIPRGCPFHPRCAYAQDVCVDEYPPLREVEEGHAHEAACHFAERFVAEGPDRPATQEVVSG